MKRLLILAIFLLSVPVSAQSPDVIRWREGTIVQNRIWGAQRYIDGFNVRAFVVDNVAVAAALIGGKKSYTVYVMVLNQSKADVHVLPQMFSLRSSEGKRFDYMNPDKIASQIERDARREALGLLFYSMLAQANSTSQTATSGTFLGNIGSVPISGTYSEQSTTTSTSPDPAKVDMAARAGQTRISSAQEYAQSIRESALRANTVMHGMYLSGYLYFKRGKAKSELLLTVPLGAHTLEFPLVVQ